MKHVKLSKKIRFPLDAQSQKEYPNREWPHITLVVIPLLLILTQNSCSDLGCLYLMLVISKPMINSITSYNISLLEIKMI
jgi:predicted metalloenzyme YecM